MKFSEREIRELKMCYRKYMRQIGRYDKFEARSLYQHIVTSDKVSSLLDKLIARWAKANPTSKGRLEELAELIQDLVLKETGERITA